MRRHADVAATADVHLAARRADRILEVGADRPALRPGRVPREPQTECERGPPAVRGNHDLRVELMAAGVPGDAAHDWRRVWTVDNRLTDREAVERGPRRDRLLQQDGVELAAADREAALVARIPSLDRRRRLRP